MPWPYECKTLYSDLRPFQGLQLWKGVWKLFKTHKNLWLDIVLIVHDHLPYFFKYINSAII